MFIPGQICRECKNEIGREEYVLICDKISKHLHKFHARCQPKDPDLQRHHGATLLPGIVGYTPAGTPVDAVELLRGPFN